MCSNNNRCAYCSAIKLRIGMTQVPTNTDRFKDWVDVLGTNFEKACKGKVCAYVCLSHFEVIKNGKRPKNAIPLPLPFYNYALDEKLDRHYQERNERSEKTVENHQVRRIPILICIICGVIYRNESETSEYVKTFVCNNHSSLFYTNYMSTLLSVLPQWVHFNEPEDDDIQIIDTKIVGQAS